MTTEQMDYVDNQLAAFAKAAMDAAHREYDINKVSEGGPENWDVCECGDYRLSHDKGRGKCSQPNDATHGFKPCKKFRMYSKAYSIPEPWPKLLGLTPHTVNPYLRVMEEQR